MPLQREFEKYVSEWRVPKRYFDRPLSDYTIDVFELDEEYEVEFGPPCRWYWSLCLGRLRINGGLCASPRGGHEHAERAVHVYEWSVFREENYFDVETGSWYKRGELPPLE